MGDVIKPSLRDLVMGLPPEVKRGLETLVEAWSLRTAFALFSAARAHGRRGIRGDLLRLIAIGAVAVIVYFIKGVRWTSARSTASRRSRSSISRAPGTHLLWLAEWLLPPRDAECIAGQAVADMREEYFQALAEGRRGKARWICVRDTMRIVIAVTESVWHRVGKFVLGFFKFVS
jgi:hypothetical protein